MACPQAIIFPPLDLATVKATACESPRQHGQAAARWSLGALVGVVRTLSDKLAAISRSTLQRILAADAIKPWQFRSWLFPRDPQFADKAARILDLYERLWQGQPLAPDEHVISADEKTSIQARARRHASTPAGPKQPARIEHEYRRTGALQYLAALDVRLGVIFGRCEVKSGKAAFARLVEQVMSLEPYRSARRVFWIVDNGSSHRGAKAAAALQKLYPNLVLVHLPIHASWLNQIEIFFSIMQRRLLTPNDFESVAALAEQIAAFEKAYNLTARPFDWRYTRRDLLRTIRQIEVAA